MTGSNTTTFSTHAHPEYPRATRHTRRPAGPRAAVPVVAAALAISATAPADLITATWLGGDTLTWSPSNPGAWSQGIVPNNDGDTLFAVIIDDAATHAAVYLAMTATVTSLRIDAGDGLVVSSNTNLTIAGGPFVNDGLVTMNGAPFLSRLYVTGGEVTLAGGGVITMNDESRIQGALPTDRLVNESTIEGDGSIGAGWMTLTNRGLIDANHGNPLEVDPTESMTAINSGTMQASAGGTLRLSGLHQNFDGAGPVDDGVIRALDGAVVELQGAAVTGGLVEVVGTGQIVMVASTVTGGTVCNSTQGVIRGLGGSDSVLGGTVTNPLGGRIIIPANNDLRFESTGSYTNNGDIDIQGGALARLYVTGGDVTLIGTGTITMTGAAHVRGEASTDRLINAGNTIRGDGQLAFNAMALTNLGLIEADGASPLVIDANDGGFDNQGALHATGSGGLTIGSAPFTSSGTVVVAAGSMLSRAGDYVQTGGLVTVAGAMEATGTIDLLGGTMRGGGAVSGDVVNVGASVEPGESAGVLTVNGTYAQHAGGTLRIELGGLTPGAGHDQLAVSGAVTLDGGLVLSLTEGYEPNVGDEFVIVTGSSVQPAFDCVDFPALETARFTVAYDETAVRVVMADGTSSPADVDGDGDVDFADLLLVLGAWGACGEACCAADVSGDGDVTFSDLLALLAEWG